MKIIIDKKDARGGVENNQHSYNKSNYDDNDNHKVVMFTVTLMIKIIAITVTLMLILRQ